jgi:hypothetical protein
LFTASIEPPTLLAASKVDGKWKFDPRVPKGTFAGTPTNRLTGKPVRVMVRLLQLMELYQEYERDVDGNWFPVGDRFELKAFRGVNMTQDGLAIVFDGFHDDVRGVYIAQRATIDDRFETPQLVLAGYHQHPQLFGSCDKLYTVDDGTTLARYLR